MAGSVIDVETVSGISPIVSGAIVMDILTLVTHQQGLVKYVKIIRKAIRVIGVKLDFMEILD